VTLTTQPYPKHFEAPEYLTPGMRCQLCGDTIGGFSQSLQELADWHLNKCHPDVKR